MVTLNDQKSAMAVILHHFIESGRFWSQARQAN